MTLLWTGDDIYLAEYPSTYTEFMFICLYIQSHLLHDELNSCGLLQLSPLYPWRIITLWHNPVLHPKFETALSLFSWIKENYFFKDKFLLAGIWLWGYTSHIIQHFFQTRLDIEKRQSVSGYWKLKSLTDMNKSEQKTLTFTISV